MATNVTDFSLSFLRLVFKLVLVTFNGDFSEFSGERYYYNPNTDVEKPAFYIYKLNEGNRLFIGIRGTKDINDATTDIEIREINTNKGTFFEGFYRSALYVYQYAYAFIKNHDGPVYFIGHSMGGGISTVLHCLAKFDFGDTKDINTIVYAPVPAISESLNKSYGNKIITIVNSDDAVPTISIGNIYDFLCKYNPLIPVAKYPWNFLVSAVDSVLSIVYHLTSLLSQTVFESLKRAISTSVDELVAYANNEKRFLIRYVPGTVYQLSIDNPSYLNESIVDPREKMNILSFSIHAFKAHNPTQYTKLLNVTLGD